MAVRAKASKAAPNRSFRSATVTQKAVAKTDVPAKRGVVSVGKTKTFRTSSSARSSHPIETIARNGARKSIKPALRTAGVNGTKVPVARASRVDESAELTTMPRVMRFLNSMSDFERMRIVRYNEQTFDLSRMRSLLKKLGDPHNKFRSIHVAGTKGKGSTAAMIAAMLQANGYRVGLYSSPHLLDVRERICVDGEMIGPTDFMRLAQKLEPIVKKSKNPPTFFDALTAMAFQHFADQKVDIAVVETGLGGRLDSTNVLSPEVTAITSISLDHTAQLGPTIRHIAREKAGIFKKGVPAVSVMQDPEAEAALSSVAKEVGAELGYVGRDIEFSYRFEANRMIGRHNRLVLTTAHSKFEHLAVPLLGEHQAVNCGLALSVIDRLKSRGFPIDDTRCTEGLATVSLPGRMETISTAPNKVLVDGAHNAASMDALLRSVGQHMTYDSLVVIFACCSDKDVAGMLERITCGADKVVFTRVNNIRSADPHQLAREYSERFGKMSQVAENLEEALVIARRSSTRDDLICITGSFYLVGEAKQMFQVRSRTA